MKKSLRMCYYKYQMFRNVKNGILNRIEYMCDQIKIFINNKNIFRLKYKNVAR